MPAMGNKFVLRDDGTVGSGDWTRLVPVEARCPQFVWLLGCLDPIFESDDSRHCSAVFRNDRATGRVEESEQEEWKGDGAAKSTEVRARLRPILRHV